VSRFFHHPLISLDRPAFPLPAANPILVCRLRSFIPNLCFIVPDGLHHDSSIANHGGKGDAHSAQAAEIVKKVLSVLDKDGDGIVTLKEFTDAGNGGLPDFKGAHLGHHYGQWS
jgi:hypothetical protein